MGYFANGFVFTHQPDFEAASKVVPGRWARGYKHNQDPIWLFDLWRPRRTARRRSPFCDPAAEGFRTDAPCDAPTRAVLTALEGLRQAIGLGRAGPEPAGIHLALAVAAATRCPAFFFAADDEVTDMACNVVAGALVSFGCRLDRLSIQYAAGQMAVIPLNYLVDDDEEGLEDLVVAAKTVPGISVLAPRDIDGGQVLYENPVRHWPQSAGSPAEILGLGTWDPLLNLKTDFTVVFEQLSSAG
jgi:hypothetical protein